MRDGLSGMFAPDPAFEVLGQASDGAEAIRMALALRPDVILMDLRMPGMDGLAAIRELAARDVPARVLVLTTYDTDSYVLPAVEAGATGYLLNREVAVRLFISEATVKSHLLNIYSKLGVNDRAAAVAEGFNRGLLIPGSTDRS